MMGRGLISEFRLTSTIHYDNFRCFLVKYTPIKLMFTLTSTPLYLRLVKNKQKSKPHQISFYTIKFQENVIFYSKWIYGVSKGRSRRYVLFSQFSNGMSCKPKASSISKKCTVFLSTRNFLKLRKQNVACGPSLTFHYRFIPEFTN